MNAGYVECCIGHLLEEDRGTPSNELDSKTAPTRPCARKKVRGKKKIMNWTSKCEQFSRIKCWDDWRNVVTDADHWMLEMDLFHTLFKVPTLSYRACEPQTQTI